MTTKADVLKAWAEYEPVAAHWRFVAATYLGRQGWFKTGRGWECTRLKTLAFTLDEAVSMAIRHDTSDREPTDDC